MTTRALKQSVFIILWCCFGATIAAQNYLPVARHYGIEEGLPHRQVNCVLEDRQGFIWVATPAGVARFDGLRFKLFNKADNGLQTDAVVSMLEDAAGNLWLISRETDNFSWGIGTVDILNPVTLEIQPLEQYVKEKPPVPYTDLPVIGYRYTGDDSSTGIVRAGTLFFGTRNPGGWVSWHPQTGWKRVAIPTLPEISIARVTREGSVTGILSRNDSHVFIETNIQGIVLQEFNSAKNNYLSSLDGGAPKRNTIFAVEIPFNTKDVRKQYWEMGTGASKFRTSIPVPHYNQPNAARRILAELEVGNLWLTENEVFTKNGEIVLDLTQLLLKKGRIIHFIDRNGGIWLAHSFGLEHIELTKDRFRRLLYSENMQDRAGIACRAIGQRGNTLWVNTEFPNGSQVRIDLQTGLTTFTGSTGSHYALTFDPAGRLWTGQNSNSGDGSGAAMVLCDPLTGIGINEGYLWEPRKSSILWTIFPATADQLWIGTSNEGVFVYQIQQKHYSKPDNRDFPELETASVVHIGRDRSGSIWMCTSTGFYKMTPEGKVAERYWTGGQGQYQFPFDNLFHFHQDAAGVFWLGTGGGGLLRWNPQTGEKQLLYRKNGLLNNFVYAVYEDDYGHLWLPTDYGIAQFDKHNLSVRRTWLPKDGVAQNEFNRISHCRGEDGTLYFGGLNGVTAFHPKNFYGADSTGARKSLILSTFQLFSGASRRLEDRTTQLLATGKIVMQPDDRYIQLEFALPDYSLPEKVTYSYKIDGGDADWTVLSEPLLRLSSLPYGTHRLRIRAQAADGTWAGNELDYQLQVRAPFYLRWWFWTLILAGVLAGSYFYYRFLLQQRMAEKETQRLQQLDTFKSRFFANISHEFRTPLTVILGLTEQLRGKPSAHELRVETEMISRNGRQLLQLVNQMLDLSRLEAGRLQLAPANGDLVAFVRFQLEAFRSYAQTRRIAIDLHSELEHLPMAFDHEKVQTILNNLLSNALKFTPDGGRIDVDLHTLKSADDAFQTVELLVRDTGIGLPPEQLDRIFDRFYQVDDSATRQREGAGIGLALVLELVRLMQGTIQAESAPGEGATFRLRLPFVATSAAMPDYRAAATPESGATTPGPIAFSESPTSDDQRPLLLIIEDNADVRFYIAQCVGDVYRVAMAANGAEGIEKARALMPDIVVSDVMMPEKDGFEVCATLKNDVATSHIPVVLLTARADFESRIDGLRRGADDYLAKPFAPLELLTRLHNLVALRRRLYERYAGLAELPPPSDDPELVLEDAFLQRFRAFVEAHLDDTTLDMPQLERGLMMSRTQIFRKVKALTGASPSVLIRTVRLHKAQELLRNQELTVAEAAYQVGFSSPSYFTKMFLETFGKTPGEWRGERGER